MKVKKIIIILSFIPLLAFAQDTESREITWQGRLTGEYLPELFSDWNTASLGGSISFMYKNSKNFFTTLCAEACFVPSSARNNYDYSSIRTAAVSLTYQRPLYSKLTAGVSLGANYAWGKVAGYSKNFPGIFAGLQFEISVYKSTSIIADVNSLYDTAHDVLTPSLKIGFIAGFVILTFDIMQYIKWDNPALRRIDAFSVPHINNPLQ